MNAEELDIDSLEELARNATPGPWVADPPSMWGDDYDIPQSAVRQKDGGNITWDDHSGEVFKPANAEFIAAANPATVRALIRRLRTAENVVKDYDANFPCDGGCNVNDGPQEDCSRHGRSPRDLWNLLDQARTDLHRAQECIDAIREAWKKDTGWPDFGRDAWDVVLAYSEGKINED